MLFPTLWNRTRIRPKMQKKRPRVSEPLRNYPLHGEGRIVRTKTNRISRGDRDDDSDTRLRDRVFVSLFLLYSTVTRTILLS